MLNKTKISIATTAAIGSLLFTSVGRTADLTTSSVDGAFIFFNDTDAAGNDWKISGNSNFWYLRDEVNEKVVLRFPRNSIAENSVIVDTSGDVNLANGSVFIDRSAKKMGIGTVAPERNLHIKANEAGIQLTNTASDWFFGSAAGNDWLLVQNLEHNRYPFAIHESAFESGTPGSNALLGLKGNNVGIGTLSPLAKLDVRGEIQATWSGTGGGLKQMFRMSANNSDASKFSDAGFVMENKRAGFSWAFRTLEDVGGFAASKQGTGEKEFEIRNTTNDATKVQLVLASGASNTNGQWLNASSRSYKKNIHELSSEDAMQALRGLKSVKYQFKRDKSNEQMVGFIAEDVPELLATKDRKTVDPLQIIAVLTRAVQKQDKLLLEQDSSLLKIKEEVKSKNQKIAAMEAKIDQLGMAQKRLEKVEELLTRLSSNSSDASKK